MSLEFQVYINGVYQGQTSSFTWFLSKIYTESPTPFGKGYYSLPYGVLIAWRIDIIDTETEEITTGDTWLFWIENCPFYYDPPTPPILDYGDIGSLTLTPGDVYLSGIDWPDIPPGYVLTWDGSDWVYSSFYRGTEEYLPTDSWQFVDGEWQWTDLPDAKGGGRLRNNLVVVAVDENGLGKILHN